MPQPDDQTRKALIAFKGGKSQRATCAALGLDESWRGTIHRIIHRIDVSMEKENEVRNRLGLPPLELDQRDRAQQRGQHCDRDHGQGMPAHELQDSRNQRFGLTHAES